MKNSKTAIRELTSRYRSVLLKCFAIAMAIGLSSGAMADTESVKAINSHTSGTTWAAGDTIGSVDLSSYAKLTDVQTTYATKTELDDYAKTADLGTIAAEDRAAGYTHSTKTGKELAADIAAYVGANADKVDTVGSTATLINDLFADKQDFLSDELGYDTKTTDAKTELDAAGFTATDFLGAVKELDTEKVDGTVTSAKGTATIFNDSTGGGAMFAGNNGITSYVGVNDRTDGIAVDAQIYAKDSTGQGARLNVTTEGIYYAVGNTADINTADNEVTTLGSVRSSIEHYIANGTDYSYTDPNGNRVTLTVAGTQQEGATAADYTGTTAADGEIVKTTQNIEHGVTQSKDKYTFASTTLDLNSGKIQFDADGKVKTTNGYSNYNTGVAEQSGDYALKNNTTLTIDKDTNVSADVLATTYKVTVGTNEYHLSADATKLLDASEQDVTASFQSQYNTLKANYEGDVTNVKAAVAAIRSANTTNKTNYGKAETAYITDGNTIGTLTTRYATLMDATTGAQTLFDTAKAEYDASLGASVDKHIIDALEGDGTGLIYNAVATLVEEKQEFVNKEFGIDTKTTDAKTILTAAGFEDQTDEGKVGLVDAALQNKAAIDTLNADETTEGSVAYAVAAEKTRATGVEATLNGKITDEEGARVAADKAIRAEMAAGYTHLDHKIDQLESKMEKGLAASAALAGLVPLSNEHKTQLSAAMGGYGSNAAVAVGAFHYLNDKTLLNLGGAYGGNSDFSYKVGVTFGF